MSSKLLVASLLLLAMASVGCVSQTGSNEKACTDSGGTVTTASCCLSAQDFPNTCLIGACGCSAENSHSVKTCECGEGRCWDGNACVAR